MKKFMDYFSHCEEYPTVAGEILPLGELWSYISNTFIDGFLNYSRPQKLFVLGRYYEWSGDKKDLWDKAISEQQHMHPEFLRMFGDDVLLLSRGNDGAWWFFWCDQDVSDCSIGRFITDDDPSEVLSLFEVYARTHTINHSGEAREFDVSRFQGWMST